MVPNALLQRPVTVVPKARRLMFGPKEEDPPVLRLAPLHVCNKVSNETPEWQLDPIKDNAGEPGRPYTGSLVYGGHAVLWWVGFRPEDSAALSEVWVDVEGVSQDRCNPSQDVKQAPKVPDIQPVMALKDEEFHSELYARLLKLNLQKRADVLLPGNMRYREFHSEYKRRAYFVRVCRRVPDSKDRKFCTVELFVNVRPTPMCSPLMTIDSGEGMGTPFRTPVRTCTPGTEYRPVDESHHIPPRSRSSSYQSMEF